MLERVISDLRERKLWPVAIVLLVATVAVPFVLAKSPASPPPPPAPVAAAATSLRASLPSVSVSTTPSHSDLNSKPHNPFTPPKQPKTVTTTSTTKSTTSSGGSGGGSQKVSHTTTSSTSTSSSNSTGSKIPSGHAKPAPAGLAPNQTYEVTLAYEVTPAATDSSGGLNTVAGLERLSPVPTADHPLLVELGVLTGGQRVLFAVLPGTTRSGPGSCIPGPVDCEVLSLGVNQIETVSSANGAIGPTQFAVTAVTVAGHPSAAAARKARTAKSARGTWLLRKAGLKALKLFNYQPSEGTLVDRRDLSVGGN
jgi:hypothetical protein